MARKDAPNFCELVKLRGSVAVYRLPPGEYVCYDHDRGKYLVLAADGKWTWEATASNPGWWGWMQSPDQFYKQLEH